VIVAFVMGFKGDGEQILHDVAPMIDYKVKF
jgi:hypothetical protein